MPGEEAALDSPDERTDWTDEAVERDQGTDPPPLQRSEGMNLGVDGIRLTDLAAKAQLSLAARSELVNQLQELGYLDRRPEAGIAAPS